MPIAPTDLVPIERIRKHVRLELDDSSQDDMLLLYAQAAIGWCLWYCDAEWTEPADVPDQVGLAMLLLIADFDQHRENTVIGASVANLRAAESLLWSCRNMHGPAEVAP